MWDLIVSVPDHCLSFYLSIFKRSSRYLDVDLNASIISACLTSER